jgi:transposase
LLLLDRSQGEARTIQQVIEAAMVSQGTIYNLKERYFGAGLDRALYEKPRTGAKPKIDGEVEAHLIALTCSDPPEGYDRWTLRLLADKLVSLEVIDAISHVAWAKRLKK